MEGVAYVSVELRGKLHLAGRLWTRARQGRETATFEYDSGWLAHPERFALEPSLKLIPGPHYGGADRPMFGAISDSTPDRWGRALMRRVERRRAEREGGGPQTLFELDYLLRVDDEARQGALRFSTRPDGPFLAHNRRERIPPLVDLPRLLAATDSIADDSYTDQDLRLLLVPGSSLGGARPKASVRDVDGLLMIAKFPNSGDETNTVLWEALALTLASKAGIEVPRWRLEAVGARRVLLLRRFDREAGIRIPFLSAMSMLEARDNEPRSYLEFADALRRDGAAPVADMRALWRRIVFSILISNTDDHLRNYGFLYSGPGGWRLSPAYDLNAVPVDVKPRVLSTAIDFHDGTASLDLALDVAGYFELNRGDATEIIGEVGRVVGSWRSEAARLGLSRIESDRMSSAFEHKDSREAHLKGR